MILVRQINVPIELDNKEFLQKKIAKKLNLKESLIPEMKIYKRSLDARDKNNIRYVYEILLNVSHEEKYLKLKDVIKSPDLNYYFKIIGTKKLDYRPIIVGSGPAGLFCAYELAMHGFKPIIIERGENIDDRIKSVENFWQTGNLNPESNVQFGCGGAGTFSDGKLNTLVKDPFNRHRRVFEIFIENGAPESILYDFNPHLGTDKLRNIVKNICNKITTKGGEFHFNSKLTNLFIENNIIKEIEINNTTKMKTNILVLAIGHSARDTFRMLNKQGFAIEPKPFAIGFRVQHSQDMISKSQYGNSYKKLAPASYKLTFTSSLKRGVYSFCMCPGGYVVKSQSEPNTLAINGMSNYNRGSSNANSAIVVTVGPDDFGHHPLDGLKFQETLEQKCYQIGHGSIPTQLYKDFLQNKITTEFGTIKPVFKGNYEFANLRNLMPEYFTKSFIEGMEYFNHKIVGFSNDDVILSGIESRTSSPLKIIRNEDCESKYKGVFPCGEGPGYAGGITTSAMDGLKVAEEIAKVYAKISEEKSDE